MGISKLLNTIAIVTLSVSYSSSVLAQSNRGIVGQFDVKNSQLLMVSADDKKDKSLEDRLSQKAKEALFDFGKSKASELLSWANKKEKFYATGVVSTLISFQKQHDTTQEEQNWIAIGYTDGSVVIYQGITDIESEYYLAPVVQKCEESEAKDKCTLIYADPEECLSEKQQCSLSNYYYYSPKNFFGANKNYNVTALSYVPVISDNQLSKCQGTLLVGFGMNTVVTRRGTTDLKKLNFTYGMQKQTDGGQVSSINLPCRLDGYPQITTESSLQADYGIKNIYQLYRPVDKDTVVRSIVYEYLGEFDDNKTMNLGVSVKEVGPVPLPIPSSSTLNAIKNAIFPKKDSKGQLSKYDAFTVSLSDKPYSVNTQLKDKTIPTYTLSDPLRGVFSGYEDGDLYLIHFTNQDFHGLSNSPLVYKGENLSLGERVDFQAYQPESNLLLSSGKTKIKLVHFADSFASGDSINSVEEHKLKGDYPVISANYGDTLFVLSNTGELTSYRWNEERREFVIKSDYSINTYCTEQGGKKRCLVNDILKTPYSIAIDRSGQYLAISTMTKDSNNKYFSKIILVKTQYEGLQGKLERVSLPRVSEEFRDYVKGDFSNDLHTSRALLWDNYYPKQNYPLKMIPNSNTLSNYGLAGNLQFFYDDTDKVSSLVYAIVEKYAPPVDQGNPGAGAAAQQANRWGAVAKLAIDNESFTDDKQSLIQGMNRCKSNTNDDWVSRNYCFYTERYFQGRIDQNLPKGK